MALERGPLNSKRLQEMLTSYDLPFIEELVYLVETLCTILPSEPAFETARSRPFKQSVDRTPAFPSMHACRGHAFVTPQPTQFK